jgi:glycosyltransferase involved in cell wall biosynthesis
MFNIAVIVVAFNAESKLDDVLKRIPKQILGISLKILVCDDASSDNTYEIGKGFARDHQSDDIEIIRHEINLGYGGNQKFGYEWAVANNFDAVVLLHGDGQYAPELIESFIRPILSHKADVVLGSRMITKGSALAGGMPFYKFVGNKILTRWQNFITGTELSEWHCGYRAYSVQSLKSINYLENSDGFDFDTQIILQMNSAGKQIIEVPIPTYYGDEICYVQGLKYARQVSIGVVKHRLKSMGFFASRVTSPEYRFKHDEHSSHGKIKKVIENLKLGSVLDVGCAGGEISDFAAQIGHKVVAVDINQPQNQLTNAIFVQHDLDKGLPLTIDGKFDLIVCADVLEHLRTPDKLLYDLQERLTTSGKIIASIPNFGNWYPRIRVLLGKFDYDARGILDQSHLRFFTRKSFTRIANTAGYDVTKIWTTGTPFEVMLRGAPKRRISWKTMLSVLAKIDRGLCRLRANLFAYQFIFELTPKTSRRRTETKN